MTNVPGVGLVAIGRNEGPRLRACLGSARRDLAYVVYVDSGSTDDSLEIAREFGAEIVELPSDVRFTAALARNTGFARLVEAWPELTYVQFVDGDCEIEAGWIEGARAVLEEGEYAVVCGRRRERHPEASVYNLLCDMEWDTDVGEIAACGGDSMMRVDLFGQVGGFASDLIAGEEPELCVRLVEAGGRILRLDAPMTIHDARMFRASQWWIRAKRAGHAYAESAARHPGAVDGANAREVRSAWFWAGFLPALALSLSWSTAGWSLGLLLAWPIQMARIASRRPRPNFGARENLIYAVSCVVGKLPHLQGVLRFLYGRLSGQRSRLIEYKGAAS